MRFQKYSDSCGWGLNLFSGSPVRFFNPVIPTRNFGRSRNPEGYLWHPASRAYFQSRISPRFRFKIPNPEPQIKEIPHPEKLIGDPLFSFYDVIVTFAVVSSFPPIRPHPQNDKLHAPGCC